MSHKAFMTAIVTSVIGAIVAGYSQMSTDVTRNQTRINGIEANINKMGNKIDEIHWHLIKRDN